MIRVAVVGDVRLHREGLAALMAHENRICVTTVAGGVPTGDRFDVVVVDAGTRQDVTLIREVADVVDEPIVALGVPEDERRVIAFAESGVLGFVEREGSLDELVAGILSAARGQASFPPRIATALLRRVTSLASRDVSPDVASLTVRERQIVQIIAEGLTNKEIAARLSIEVATVKNHVHNILEKLKVSRRSDAVARLRLVERDEAAPAPSQGGWSRAGSMAD